MDFCFGGIVTQRRNVLSAPSRYVRSGSWPEASLEPFPPAVMTQVFCRNLSAAIGNLSMREVARRAEINPRTLRLLLEGESWPDTVTVVKLEVAFNQLLWPTDRDRLEVLGGRD